jgi:hypothetical protein
MRSKKNEEMFLEALYLIYFTKKKGNWVNLSLYRLLLSMEEIITGEAEY